jgi:hypothetical protein
VLAPLIAIGMRFASLRGIRNQVGTHMKTLELKSFLVRTTLLFLSLTGCATAATAAPHPIRWANRHRFLMATSAVMFAASAADAQTSMDAQKRCPVCSEANPFVGPHPSAPTFWSFVIAGDSGVALLDWRLLKRNRTVDKSALLTITGLAASLHAYAAYHNTTLPVMPK